MWRKYLTPFVLVLMLAAAPALGQAPSTPPSYSKTQPQLLGAMAEVVAKPSEATVRVRYPDGEKMKDAALGTVVGADGYIVTKFSELRDGIVCKLKDGRELPAKIIGAHPEYDLALLKVDAKDLPVAPWRDSKDDLVGSWVASAGLEKEPVAVGVISVLARKAEAGPRLPNPTSGFLGVRMEPAEKGVKIVEVTKDTAADKAGIKVGDIVTSINGTVTPDVDAMFNLLSKTRPKDKIKIKLERDGKPIELAVELGKRPPDRGDVQNAMGSTLSEKRRGFPIILQHDTVLKATDCGGPLVDLDGMVIGVNIARAGRTESYAIPSEVVRQLVDELKAGKYPAPKLEPVVKIDPAQIKELEEKLRKLQQERAAVDKRIKETEEELKKLKEKAEKK